MPSLTISRTTEPPEGWGAFAAAYGTFYHFPEWTTCLGDIYRLRLDYYSARADGELRGILAVAEIPPLLGPRRLVSLPFSYAAGTLALDHETSFALAATVREWARDRGIRRVELKSRGEHPLAPGFQRSSRYSTYEIQTDEGPEAVWQQLHAGSTQRSIKKGQRAGMVVRRGEAAEDWLVMAELEERTAHGHGLPAPPRRFFTEGCVRLQRAGLADLYLASSTAGTPAAAITVWKGPRSWIYAYGASDPALLAQRPNHLLLWTAIQDAIAAGCRFDLGRAAPEQEGLVEFKRRWGGQALPLAYDYWPAPAGLNVGRRDRGSMAAMAAVWSRLPARIARLGAGLYRYLG
ncbi:MAG TPA: GNAT family N-acetyltransferase [Gemmatimonadales bacterium]|nr:GNAT family N-acetyltransferase [Gemmatimonadales bacterium]